ncbi:hypothetical protein [Tissierella praeacuta]|uniref:hypothetical protein n=1 Tax=Tissierella praeacuta TaxID=43131 RepID=UPI00289860CE|nr:hypothetical protein [Tissierella praeacuta]
MVWKPPKTDWKDNDVPTSIDFNRIEENIKENNNIVIGSGVPKGAILMWSGSITTIPSGWALCNGINGTPDLRDRFIVGAGRAYSIGATGGEKEVKLTEAQMPEHKHGATTNSSGTHSHTIAILEKKTEDRNDVGVWQSYWKFRAGTTQTAGSHTHSVIVDNAGSGQPHENRPPYYALAFIMKL